MHVCYVDESGNDQLLDRYDAAPVLVIAGLVVAEAKLKDLIWDFLDVKKQFIHFGDTTKLSDVIRTEIKGGDLRADIRVGSRRRDRRAIGILDAVMDLLEGHNVNLIGQIWVKADGAGVPQAFYPDAIAHIAADFQGLLAAAESQGLMILDARTKVKNVPSVNGITTRKFKSGGDQLRLLVESPVFGHSDAHVALQMADIVASALIFPLACLAYCHGLTANAHPHANYERLRVRYASRLRDMEYRYTNREGERRGGIVVRDKRGAGKALDLYIGATSSRSVTAASPTRTRRRLRGGVDVESMPGDVESS